MTGTAVRRTSEPVPLTGGPYVYRQLAELAARAPVVRVLLHGSVPAWLLTRPDNIVAAARDPRITSDGSVLGRTGPSVKFGFMAMDGPEHTRLRKMVADEFTPRRIAGLEPYVVRVVDELIAAIAPSGSADLVADLALPLPLRVICELLGVPLDERERFEAAADDMLRPAAGDPARSAAARGELFDYLEDLADGKRARPGNDLLSVLANSVHADRREVVEIGALLLVAGYETTANLIGTSILALFTDPKQLLLLRDQPERLPDAVDELVRHTGPVALGVTRYTREPVTIASTSIPAGERIILGLGAANHDPGRYGCPHHLDFSRPATGHFGFGHGPHYCLGAPLARLETQIALRAVLGSLDELALADAPTWQNSIFHGLERLPVTFRPHPPSTREGKGKRRSGD
ncbi:cytochrome P450 [Streptomyces flaveolus]|uniref:cytochrome P450 family protein n=1 Tax=Streptomyces flaveolus TaxID=67297 RepID=UPI00342E9644